MVSCCITRQGYCRVKVKSNHWERVPHTPPRPIFGGFTHLVLGLLHATETTAIYSNSYRELSGIYGKYKDVIINDPKPESTAH